MRKRRNDRTGPKIVCKSVVEQPMNGTVESVVVRGSMEELERSGAGATNSVMTMFKAPGAFDVECGVRSGKRHTKKIFFFFLPFPF